MSIALHFGSQFLKSPQTLPTLLKNLALTPQLIIIIQQSTQLLDPQLKIPFARLKIVTNTLAEGQGKSPSILSFKLWMEKEVMTPLMLLKDGINLILLQGSQGKDYSLYTDFPLSILIHDLSELTELLSMSIFQLQRRCKLQRVLLLSQRKNIEAESKEKLKRIALEYMRIRHEESLRIFLGFMRYNTKTYIRKIKKVFDLWSIHTHERGIQKLNEEIINQEFCCIKYKRNLLRKVFASWRRVGEGRQGKRKGVL